MGNQAQPTCVITTQINYYTPGDTVLGSVYIEVPKPYPCSKLILSVEGFEKCEFTDPVNGQQKSLCKLIDTNFVLYEWGHKEFLKGQYAYPFVFRLPNYLPGSFKEDKSDYKAAIQYRIKAVCISPIKEYKHIETVQELVIRESIKDYGENLYGETFLYPSGCCKSKKGVSKISCYFEKNHYFPGEECVIICEADNFKCEAEITEINCEFIKNITLNSDTGVEKVFTQTLNTVVFPGLAPSNSYTGEMAQRKSIPLKYKSTQAEIHPTTLGRRVRCEYSIRVRPKLAGFCVTGESNFSAKLIILQPGIPMPYQQAPKNWEPQVHKQSNIILNYNNSNDMLDSMIEP